MRGKDKRGNVRPADDRYLTVSQTRMRDKAVAQAEAREADHLEAIRLNRDVETVVADLGPAVVVTAPEAVNLKVTGDKAP